jgi:ABC-type transport system involved in multi-copper enzyme maturation permease subunit
MVLLPVVEREMRVAARGRTMYRVRFWAAMAMAGVMGWSLLHEPSYLQDMSQRGEEILSYLTLCAFIFSAAIGALATSDAVSREKREGTLGLLFLTDLKGYDVICGKMAANSLNVLYALVATVPVMGIPLLMGGITFAQFAKISLVLVLTMVLSLSAGIFVSTYSRNERKAMVITFFAMAALILVPFLLTAWCVDQQWIPRPYIWMGMMFSPGYGIIQTLVGAGGSGLHSESYWFSVAWEALVAAGLLAMACAHVTKSWEEGPPKKPWRFRLIRAKETSSRTANGRAWLDTSPILWLTMQSEEASRGRAWLVVGAMLTIFIVGMMKFGLNNGADPNLVFFEMFFINTPLKIWIAAEASRFFSESRNNNALELILSTPLHEGEIIKGQWRALRQQFFWPVAATLTWEILVTIYNLAHPQWSSLEGSLSFSPQILLMVADCITLAIVGMRFGLTCKGRIRALLASLTLVLVIPTAITLFCCIGAQNPKALTFLTMLRVFVVDPIVAAWAGTNLVRDLRAMAAPKA